MMRAMICLAILVAAAAAFAQAPNQDLWRLYMAREHATVLDSTYARLERSPGDRDLVHLLGRTLFDMGRKEEAMVHLRPQAEGAIHDHRYAWALLYTAGYDIDLGHVEAATAALREARDAAITGNSARNAESSLRFFALHEDFDGWQRRRSEHFIFTFSPKLVGRGLDEYVREHERAYAEMAEFTASLFAGEPR